MSIILLVYLTVVSNDLEMILMHPIFSYREEL